MSDERTQTERPNIESVLDDFALQLESCGEATMELSPQDLADFITSSHTIGAITFSTIQQLNIDIVDQVTQISGSADVGTLIQLPRVVQFSTKWVNDQAENGQPAVTGTYADIQADTPLPWGLGNYLRGFLDEPHTHLNIALISSMKSRSTAINGQIQFRLTDNALCVTVQPPAA